MQSDNEPLMSIRASNPTRAIRGACSAQVDRSHGSGCAGVGRRADRGRIHLRRVSHRRRARHRTDTRVRCLLSVRLCGRAVRGALPRLVHGGGAAAVAAVRRGAARLSVLHRRVRRLGQGCAAQRRDPAGQPVPADAARHGRLDRTRRAAGVPGPTRAGRRGAQPTPGRPFRRRHRRVVAPRPRPDGRLRARQRHARLHVSSRPGRLHRRDDRCRRTLPPRCAAPGRRRCRRTRCRRSATAIAGRYRTRADAPVSAAPRATRAAARRPGSRWRW